MYNIDIERIVKEELIMKDIVRGKNVTITDDFVYVGAKALPRTLTSRTYSTLSVPVRRQLEAIAIVIERI